MDHLLYIVGQPMRQWKNIMDHQFDIVIEVDSFSGEGRRPWNICLI